MKSTLFLILLLIALPVSAQRFSTSDYNLFNKYCVDFRTGNLPKLINGKWGFVDSKDQLVIPAKYDSVLYAGLGICLAKNKAIIDLINQDLQVLRSFKAGEVYFDGDCQSVRYKKDGTDRYLDYVNYKLLDSTLSQSWYTRRNTTKYKLYDFIPNRDFDPAIIESITYDELIRKKLYSFSLNYKDGSHVVFDSIRYFSLENPGYFFSGGDNGDLEVYDIEKKATFNYLDYTFTDICNYEGEHYLLFKKGDSCVVLNDKREVQMAFTSPSKRVNLERSSGYVYMGSKMNPRKILFFPNGKEVKGEFAIINGSTTNFLRAETEDSIFYYHRGERVLSFKTDTSGKTSYYMDFDEKEQLLKVKKNNMYLLYSSSGKLLLSSVGSFEIKESLIEQKGDDYRSNYYLYNSCLDELIDYGNNEVIRFGKDQFVNTKDKSVINSCGEKIFDASIDYKWESTRLKSGNRILALNTPENHAYIHSKLKFLPINGKVKFESVFSIDRNPYYVNRNNKYLGRHFEIQNQEKEIVGVVDNNGNVINFSAKTLVSVNHFGKYYFLLDSAGDYDYIRF